MTKEQTESVELLVSTHYHRGQPCKKGDRITVTPQQAERLERDGIARRVNKTEG